MKISPVAEAGKTKPIKLVLCTVEWSQFHTPAAAIEQHKHKTNITRTLPQPFAKN